MESFEIQQNNLKNFKEGYYLSPIITSNSMASINPLLAFTVCEIYTNLFMITLKAEDCQIQITKIITSLSLKQDLMKKMIYFIQNYF